MKPHMLGKKGEDSPFVAGEVLILAHRSSVAEKEIEFLIGESVYYINESSSASTEKGSIIDEIMHSINDIPSVMSEISLSSSEQSQGIAQVNIAVGHMESVTLQNATLVEEATSATQALAEQSRSLKQVAHVFIV